jgi:hypothetical protein
MSRSAAGRIPVGPAHRRVGRNRPIDDLGTEASGPGGGPTGAGLKTLVGDADKGSMARTTLRATVSAGIHSVVVLLAGCGSDATATPSADVSTDDVVVPAALRPGQVVPTPKGDPVLTLTGKIGMSNDGSTLAFDVPTLDRLGLSRLTVYDPWTKRTTTFQGMWLADLLRTAQVPSSATKLHLTALDDYQVDLTLAEVKAGGVFLATKTGDGSAIPVEDGGPTRIVFTAGARSATNNDQWIWSLKSIDVR